MSAGDVFRGCIPALITPCDSEGSPAYDALVETGKHSIATGMHAVVYCGSMGDWPLLTDVQRQTGVERLVQAGISVIVGTGAQNTRSAVEHTRHARRVGATGLMVIPRVLSRGISPAAQKDHFSQILEAAEGLPAIIYNSPYYGFETKADLFFDLQQRYSNLVGFKEFGGSESLSYASQHITGRDDSLILMVGVDTQVVHGFINCGAQGAITGVGNALPKEVLRLVQLCERAAVGCAISRRLARELDGAMHVLATFDEGPDLVLFYKRLMVLEGHTAYEHQINPNDQLSASQLNHLIQQWRLFRQWWANWEGASDAT